MFGPSYLDRIFSAVGRTSSRSESTGSMASKAGLAFACTLAVLVFRHRWKARMARADNVEPSGDGAWLHDRGRIDADVEGPGAQPSSPAHAEWLLDEAVQETFPASDPPSAVRPGSIAGRRAHQ